MKEKPEGASKISDNIPAPEVTRAILERRFKMTREELAQRLEAVTEDGVATWYAIHQTPEDIDDGDGSTNPEEAAEMALREGADNIVLIYDNGMDEAYARVDIE